MAAPADLVSLEDSWVGTAEDPPGSNRTFIGDRFGWNGVAWCAETQSVACEQVFGRRLFWSASVAQWIDAAKNGVNGLAWVEADGPISAGMLVTYDFGSPRGNPEHFHIAMVRDPGSQDQFQTDGGNEGDALRQQWRDRKYVQGFIALPYDPDPAPAPDAPVEDDMPASAAPAVAFHSGDVLRFVRGVDGHLWGKWGASDWFDLGGILTSGPAAMTMPDGTVVVEVRGQDGQTWELRCDPAGVWGDWMPQGGQS